MLSFECCSLKLLDKILHKTPQDSSSGTTSSLMASCLPSCVPDVMHVTLSPRPSPSIFAYYKRSKTEGGTALGMMLPQLQCPRRANYQLTFGLESHQSCCLLENSSVSKARKACIYIDQSRRFVMTFDPRISC